MWWISSGVCVTCFHLLCLSLYKKALRLLLGGFSVMVFIDLCLAVLQLSSGFWMGFVVCVCVCPSIFLILHYKFYCEC